MLEEIADPLAVFLVGLASRYVLDVLGIGQKLNWCSPSKMFQTGFPYTPVASLAMCSTPWALSHVAISRKGFVIVPNRRFALANSPLGRSDAGQP